MEPGAHEQLQTVLGQGDRLDECVLEDAQAVGEGDTARRAVKPGWILAAGEAEHRLVGRAALDRLHERPELRGEARVDLDDPGRAFARDEELDVEEAAVEPERRQDTRGDLGELGLSLGWQRGRVLEALEAVRALVLDGVRDADRRHLPVEDVALERDLVALEQLLGQEAAHGVRMETGQRGDPRISRHVGVDLLELLDLERIVDTTHALGETADDRLHEERRPERRPAVEQREARRRGRHGRTLQCARSRLELTGDERARRRARQASPFRDQRREQGRAILGADDAVGRQPVALLEEPHRVELVARVEIGARVVDPEALVQTGRPDCSHVPLLRADDEDVLHQAFRVLLECYSAGDRCFLRTVALQVPPQAGFEPSDLSQGPLGRGRGPVEHAGVARAHEHDAAAGEGEVIRLVAGHLGPQALAAGERELDPDLEAEVDDALDRCACGGPVRAPGGPRCRAGGRTRRRAGSPARRSS